MGRHRIITLLGLTSLVATMVTISRYSSTFSEPTAGRLHITQQKLYAFENRLRLIASEQNSNKTVNNLLENLYKTQTSLQSKLVSVKNSGDMSNKVLPVLSSSISSVSSGSPVHTNSPQIIIESSNDLLASIPVNSISNKVNIEYEAKGSGSRSGAPVPATDKPTVPKEADTKGANTIYDTKAKKILKTNLKFINNNINIVKNDNDINIDVDQQKQSKDNNSDNNQKLQLLDSLDDNNENKLTKIAFKPKLVFDTNDLKTTESMKIDKPLGCDTDLGATLDLLVIVNSAVDHMEARDAIRQTWGKFAIERGALLLFLIGSTSNTTLQDRVLAEDKRNADLLQGWYSDNYFNLTLKTISMLKWISDNCAKVKYVLKVDDDMFVNMQHITDFSETRSFNKCIIGKLAKKWKPHRNTNNKWYVPPDAFNGSTFPNFATGPAYMLSGDAATPLYKKSIELKPLYLEDVYITGIVAERAGIKRLNHAMIRNTHINGIDSCTFSKFMTSHKHSPKELIRLWDRVYSEPTKSCNSIKTTKKPVRGSYRIHPAQNRLVTPPRSRTARAAGAA